MCGCLARSGSFLCKGKAAMVRRGRRSASLQDVMNVQVPGVGCACLALHFLVLCFLGLVSVPLTYRG